MTVSVNKIIGHESDIGSDVLTLVAAAHIPYIFPDKVYDDLAEVPNEVLDSELEDREDFTNDLVITIDGDDSKDFDDAINLKVLSNGNYRLAVHIADVSHYVKENGSIDKEALSRGTSIYLVDRVIPMLPEKLSNGICSLNEGVVRLVLSCIMEFDKKGKICDTEELLYYSYKIGKKDYEYYVYEEGGNLTKITRKELKKKIKQKKYNTMGKKENYGADCGDNFFRD